MYFSHKGKRWYVNEIIYDIKIHRDFLCLYRNDYDPSVFCAAYKTEKTADDRKNSDELFGWKFLSDESGICTPAAAYLKPVDTYFRNRDPGVCSLGAA